jgi:hypothetical protein
MDPINYMLPGTGLAGATSGAFTRGVDTGIGLGEAFQATQNAEAQRTALAAKTAIAQQQAAAKAAADAEAKARQDRMYAMLAEEANRPGGPSIEGTIRLKTEFPEQSENLVRGFKEMSEIEKEERKGQLLAGTAAVMQGKPEEAVKLFNDLAKAYDTRQRTKDAAGLRSVAESIQRAPGQAQLVMQMQLAELLGPDFEKTLTGLLKQPAEIEKSEAEARIKTAEAEIAPRKLVADAILTEQQAAKLVADTKIAWARYNLDKRRLEAENDRAVRELGKVRPEVFKEVLAATVAGSVAMQQANDVRQLREDYKTKIGTSGVLARKGEELKEFFGTENEQTAIRKRYAALSVKDIIGNAPPGALSEKELTFIREPVPAATANKELIDSHLAKIERIALKAAKARRLEAAYLNTNGGFGPLDQPIRVDGMVIPAGTSYSDAIASISKTDAVRDAVEASMPEMQAEGLLE